LQVRLDVFQNGSNWVGSREDLMSKNKKKGKQSRGGRVGGGGGEEIHRSWLFATNIL